ncbi:hypothetical protein ACFQV4_01325 [Streptomyces thermocarboxydus]
MAAGSVTSSEVAGASIVLEAVDEAVETALAIRLSMPERPVIDATTRDLVSHLRVLMAEELGFDEDPAVQALFREGYRVLDLTRRPTEQSPLHRLPVHARRRRADQTLRRRLPRDPEEGPERWLTKPRPSRRCAGSAPPCPTRNEHDASSSADLASRRPWGNSVARTRARGERPGHGSGHVHRVRHGARGIDRGGGVPGMVSGAAGEVAPMAGGSGCRRP